MPLASAARRPPEPDDVDFTVSASLPPMVAGGVAGEMELSVPYLYPKPGVLCPIRYMRDDRREPTFLVRMQWWGDSGPGTVFKPGLLRERDEDGERARRKRLSKATCVLFPIRCRLDGLLTYLKDMGSIALDVLAHEGEPGGARHVGRCVIPVGSWGGQLDAHPGSRESGVVADGYFPVLSLDGNKYGGDLRVCLRACLGGSSKLRNVLAVAKLAVDKTGMGREGRETIEALGDGTYMPADAERGDQGSMTRGWYEEGLAETGRRTGPAGVRRVDRVHSGLPARASFDRADFTSGYSDGSPPPSAAAAAFTVADAATAPRLPRGSAPLSSFQLNEALAKFDASDTLPMWPTPKGSLYRPPETRGEAPPTPRVDPRQARGMLTAAGAKSGPGTKTSAVSGKVGEARAASGAPTWVGVAHTGNVRIPSVLGGGAPPERYPGRSGPRELGSSISPERQAPDPAGGRPRDGPDASQRPLSGGDDDRGGDGHRGRARAGAVASASPQDTPASPPLLSPPRPHPSAGNPASEPSKDSRYLAELLNRGKDLREKMALATGPVSEAPATAATAAAPPPSTSTQAYLPAAAPGSFVGLSGQPDLVGGALLDASLRDDIDSIFGTLSDGDPPVGDDASGGGGVLVRDSETRGSEGRIVDLLLEAAGPPPSSLAFPALAAVERRRADSLARVRFLRVRLSRLVMFGSMTSATEGHGWQLRFRLPAFATPPGRSSAPARRRASGAQAGGRRGDAGGSTQNARVVSVPVPPRASASTLGKSKATVRRGRPTSGTAGSAVSFLRVRRGFGACDLVVGETSLLEEVVCAVDMDDACVSRWMETAVEFLLIDGKTDGAPRLRPAGQQPKNHIHLRKQQRRKESSTVGPGDRVAAVATLPLRDLVLSADLGVATTLDLIEVSDFWAAEDARIAASGRTGRGGRPLRNPYRSDASRGGGARPLVLGDRAVGALAVALELVPGEQDVSPEHSHPEVARWSRGGSRPQVATAGQEGVEMVELEPEESAAAADEREGGAPTTTDLGSMTPRPMPGAKKRSDRGGGAARDGDGGSDVAEASEVEWSVVASVEDPRGREPGQEKQASDGSQVVSPAARSSPDLEGSWREGSGEVDIGPPDADGAVMLRIDRLTLASAVEPGVEQVRVAYSFTQVEGHTPTVTHRSVRGHRCPPPAVDVDVDVSGRQQHTPRFAFDHREVYPAPTDSSSWRLGANASRVFEVWGGSAEGPPEDNGGNPRQAEALLGLAKVSLRPFAAYGSSGRVEGEGEGEGEEEVAGAGAAAAAGAIAVGADGPVVVVDPFSGRTVGELHLYLALGASSTIAALSASGPKGGDVATALAAEGSADESEHAEDGGVETGTGTGTGTGTRRAGGMNEREEKTGWLSRETDQKETAEGVGGALPADQEPPALDDSVAELSMLLNPGRAESPKADAGRCSGGFTGLVRHVIELSAVGELPLPLDGATVGEGGVEEPVGCAIEYRLPSVQASLGGFDREAQDCEAPLTAGQTHELWWDADSGILNSRARHTIKVPGGMLDERLLGSAEDSTGGGMDGGTATGEGRSLNTLLDCMLGNEDVVLSLFWSAGGAGARQSAPWDDGYADGGGGNGGGAHEGNVAAETTMTKEQRISPLGKVVLRRSDVLPLVRRTSASVVLRLPIEPAGAGTGEGDKAPALPVPEMLPLSVSYRREPSAVARRKSRGRGGCREVGQAAAVGVGGESQEYPQDLDASASSCEVEGVLSQADASGHPLEVVDLGKAEEKGESGEVSEDGRESGKRAERGGAGGDGDPPGSKASDGRGRGRVHRSSRTEHLLPARTKLCVRVESVCLETSFVEEGRMVGKEGDGLLWVSFDFPGAGSGGQAERKEGGVFVWKPGGAGGAGEEGKRPEIHWSPPAAAASQGGACGRVAPLQWSVELPVTIDAAFVQHMHTRYLELRVWRGDRADWPTGGTACGVAKVVLRSLLTTLGGVGGDLAITKGTGGGGGDRIGSVAARLFFKHRGLGSNEDADADTDADAAAERETRQPAANGAGADEEEEKDVAMAAQVEAHGAGGGGGRRRAPVTFREEVEVFGEEQAGPSSQTHRDPAARNDGADMTTTATTTTIAGRAPLAKSVENHHDKPGGGVLEESEHRGFSSHRRQRWEGPGSASPSGAESELRVYVERAMRLVATPAPPSSGEPEVAGRFASPGTSLPSTYVTFRWEEEGKPPLRSPLLSRSGPSASAEAVGVAGGGEENWKGKLTNDGELGTPVVENSLNPVFEHAAQLRLADPSAWGRVCGPSAALVFRVWRRARCSWWVAPEAASGSAAGGQQAKFSSGLGAAAVATGSRFGDKLIGSAVVGLDVLRGAVDTPEGQGLREIDGWYHVLDDLQRPQGQLKVRVRPQLPSSESDQEGPMPPDDTVGYEQALVPAALDLSPRTESANTAEDVKDSRAAVDTPSSPSPPLHDTQAHLRSVHALLDSLPAELRSTRPRRPLPLLSSSPSPSPAPVAAMPMPTDSMLELLSPSQELQSPTRSSGGAPSKEPRPGRSEPFSLPELRRMLSSLDRVDRRLFALGECHSVDHDDDGNDGGSDRAGAEISASGRAEGGEPAATTNGTPLEAAAEAQSRPEAAGADHHQAISRLQQAWRARAKMRREAAEAGAERAAYAVRRKRRQDAATAIQTAYRRAQARHRAAAAAQERRRREDRQRRRAAACAVLERAWRAFETRRRAARELAEARGRAAAAVAAAARARRAEEVSRGAVLVQAVWRGMSARAAVARRFEASRARTLSAAAAAASEALPMERELSSHPTSSMSAGRLAAGVTPTPRPLPSTFYNQLSQDPRRRLQLPESHLAVSARPSSHGLPPPPPAARSLAASHSAAIGGMRRKSSDPSAETEQSERIGPRPLARSAGAVRAPRFADQETARIARIMKGNLQHWASARSSSSSDDVDL
eukprot:g9134.t1